MYNLSLILASLSSLTMTYSTMDYEAINQENSINVCNSYINSRVCYSFDGSERFVLNNDLETYHLYDNLSQKEIKSWNSTEGYLVNSSDNEILLYSTSKDSFYSFDGESMINLKDNRILEDYEISTIAEDDLAAGSYAYVKEFSPNSKSCIDNYEYFVKLANNHSENKTNLTCSIVSFSTLLGYYDTFYDDNMISETYDNVAKEKVVQDNYKLFTQSPGVDKMNNSNRFHDYLCNLSKLLNGFDPREQTMNQDCMKKLYSNYLENLDNVYCDLNMYCGSLHDAIHKTNVDRIKKEIDNNKPVLVYGCGHATVAFAYDDKFVYVQGDRNYIQKTSWNTLDDAYKDNWLNFYEFGMVDINIKSQHNHSNNYYNINSGKYICPCGYTHK